MVKTGPYMIERSLVKLTVQCWRCRSRRPPRDRSLRILRVLGGGTQPSGSCASGSCNLCIR